ncbi:carbamate kinase [Halobacillus mangrovi]|uniref:carbamate kinase n=1 Tax=Halobacillus mangrovi TaxID=402384 RepID=UPI003D964B67
MKRKKIVIALGGNAIQSKDPSAEAQQKAIRKTVEQIVAIIEAGYDVIITHGNGPQVGNLMLQQKATHSNATPAMPLDTCGAMTQGMLGYWLQNAIREGLEEKGIHKPVGSVITQVEVSKNDPAFTHPSKPIGPFYKREEAHQLMKDNQVLFVEDAGRGWRRVVPSPKPIHIVEHQMIQQLIQAGNVVIAVGGGGIPVTKIGDHYHGVEAVIDKDFASEKLAESIEADIFLVLTNVSHVSLNYNQSNAEPINEVTTEALKKWAADGQFAPGSMLPKVEAAVEFVESKAGRKSIITSLDFALEALEGKTGTHISCTPSSVTI